MSKIARATKKQVTKDPRWVAFGQRLVKLRRDRGWRAMDVAKLIEVDPATYSHIENGNRATGPERRTIEQLADLHGMSVDELLREQKAVSNAPPQTAEQDRAKADTGREVFPRADGRPTGRDADAIAAPELTAIREAVSDAIYSVFQDLTASLGEARAARRAAAERSREDRRTGTDATRGENRR